MKPEDALMVLDLVDSGIILLDKQGCITFWNDFISKSSHIDLSSIVNKPLFEVFPSINNSRIAKAVDKAITLNFPSILSYKLLKTQLPLYRKSLATKPPYLIVQSIVVKPIVEKGENNGCVIYINDVSAASMREEDLTRQSDELKKALNNYNKAKDQFEQLFKSAYSGIIVFDDRGVIEAVNDAASMVFEHEVAIILGKNITEYIPNIVKYYCEEKQSYTLQGFEDFSFEEILPLTSKKYITVSINKISDYENKYFVYVNDVTASKVSEERLLAANSELEEFAYRTSHDLRSPIISSLGLLSVARQSLEDKSYDKVEQCFDFAEKSLKKLEVLVRDILKLSEAKNIQKSIEEIHLKEIVADTFDAVKHLDGFEKIECRVNLQHIRPLISDKKRITMILENLISNAVKYYDPKQAKPYIEIHSMLKGENFVLTVSDNGLGIPSEQKHKLFKMFNRFHPKVAFGSGIGLYLMKKSAEVVGGDILYVDQPQGTAFQLVIPRALQRHSSINRTL